MAKNIAITIGINYQNIDNNALGLSRLNYPHQDAQRLHDFLKHEEKFDKVWLLSDIKGNSPNRTNLIRLLTVDIPGLKMNSEDNLWFFFAGHGKHKNNTTYLMPVDGFAGNVERTGFEINEITEDLKQSGAGNIILIIDACRNDGTRSRSLETDYPKGIITIYSCSPGQESLEIDRIESGAFTHVLLEGLRQNGGQNCATVERLEQYLLAEVPKVQPGQNPCIHVDPPTKKNFILLPRQATLQADIKRLKEEAKDAELDDNYDFAIELWQRIIVAASGKDSDEFTKAISRILKKQAKLQREPEIELKSAIETPIVIPEVAGPTKQASYLVITVDSYGKEINRTPGHAQYFTENLSGIPLDMVFIKGDTFIMGSPDSESGRSESQGPQHRVTVPDFYMGKYAVTQAQYQAIMGNNPSKFKGDNRPVEQVSWNEAVAFCQKLSNLTGKKYRLPSEAEWEYACRGGTTTPFHFGETITPDLVNYDGNYPYANGPKGQSRGQTTEVGSFPPNAFGLYDMHGNVWEWCEDIWHDNYDGAPTDGTSWLKNQQNNTARLLRGGSWFFNALYCRCAVRFDSSPEFRDFTIGFRLVVSQ